MVWDAPDSRLNRRASITSQEMLFRDVWDDQPPSPDPSERQRQPPVPASYVIGAERFHNVAEGLVLCSHPDHPPPPAPKSDDPSYDIRSRQVHEHRRGTWDIQTEAGKTWRVEVNCVKDGVAYAFYRDLSRVCNL